MICVRSLTCCAALLYVGGVAWPAAQMPGSSAPGTAAAPQRDPVTVRGCLDKRWLTIVEHDSTDLSGVRRVRLRGSRAMLALVDDGRGNYVEITGDLEVGARDRIETRRKRKIGSKTTISIGASAEQVNSADAVTVAPEPTLIVDAFVRLGDQCPRR